MLLGQYLHYVLSVAWKKYNVQIVVLVEDIKFLMYCIFFLSFFFSSTAQELNVSLLFICKPSKDIYGLVFFFFFFTSKVQ